MLIELKPFSKENLIYGHYYENEKYFVFFGNKNFKKEHFSFFPNIQFQFLKQVHGNNIAYFERHQEELLEADGHYTAIKNFALVIQTADCLPVLVFDEISQKIMALHAGWRGIENKIIPIGIGKLLKDSPHIKVSIFVGPHIQQNSFEVDLDVAQKILNSIRSKKSHYSFERNEKYFVDLKKIVQQQVAEIPLIPQYAYYSDIDTKTNENYSSYRRLKEPCRNYSFIFLK